MHKYFILIFLCVCLVNRVTAQEFVPGDIDTDRPDQTESPVTIRKKWVQIEHGFGIAGDGAVKTSASSTLFRYGLFNFLELRLETDFIHTNATGFAHATTELQPVIVGAKVPLWEEKRWIPKTSILLYAGWPFLAARSFRNFDVQRGMRIAFQNNLSQTISWGYNAGIEWDGQNSSPYYLYTFSNGINFTKKLYGFVEAFGFINKVELPQHSLDAGLSYLAGNNCKLDISSAVGLTKPAPDWSVAIGISVSFTTSRLAKREK